MKKDKKKSDERTDIRRQAEDVLKGKNTDLKKLSSVDAQSLVHELQVHQIELEMQNEELRRTQIELEDARNRYSDLYDFAPLGYFTFDKNGLILQANLTGANKLGIERGNLIKKPFSLYIVPDFKDAFYSHMRQVFNTETQMTCELMLVDKKGHQFDVQLESMPLRDIDGNLLARTAMSDITERKQADETLKNYAIKLEDSNRLKDLFTDIMRHDLLNPLGVIKTATEQMLHMETKDERMRNMLQMIKRNADKLIDMIQCVSMYATLESAEKLERKSLDLNEIFIAVADNFKLQLEEKNMTLEYTSKGECFMMANPMIDAIFSNLLSNAIKYSPAGRKIKVNIIDEREHYKIYVRDWGYGIKDEDKAKLFTRFQRVGKEGVEGSGLGLAIVKRIVDLHGGKIYVESKPGIGSTFTLLLPIMASKETEK
ncbi:MAG: PAS domain-containing sensor histidine kinase [ANME-2 cluster archaeon]|nr:PAS domain-containing sensor histidine kinase [ANME-2 cluster archaeon]